MIDLLTKEKEAPKIDLLAGLSSPGYAPLPDNVAEDRAFKYNMALGSESPGIPEIKKIIQSPGGGEAMDRHAEYAETKSRSDAAMNIIKNEDSTSEEIESAILFSKNASTSNIMEKRIAEAVVATSVALAGNEEEFNLGMPDPMSQALYDQLVDTYTRKEAATKILENRQAQNKSMGWGGYLYNSAEQLIPLWSGTTRISDTLGEKLKSYLPGNNIREQRMYLARLSTPEAIALLKQIDDEVSASNPLEAEALLASLIGDYDATDAMFENFFFGADVLGLTPLGTGRKVASKALGKMALRAGESARIAAKVAETDKLGLRAAVNNVSAKGKKIYKLPAGPKLPFEKGDMRERFAKGPGGQPAEDIPNRWSGKEEGDLREAYSKGPEYVKNHLARLGAALSQPNAKVDEVLSASGHIDEASKIAGLAFAKRAIPKAGEAMKDTFAALTARVPLLFSPKQFLVDASKAHIGRSEEIAQALLRSGEAFADAIRGVMNIDRIPVDVMQMALDLAANQVTKEAKTKKLGSSSFSIERFAPDSSGVNVGYLETKYLRKDGTLFEKAIDAENFAKGRLDLPEGSYNVTQEGGGFAVRVQTNIDETGEFVRQALLKSPENKTNYGRSKLLGFIPILPKTMVNPSETLSKFQSKQRKTLLHAHSAMAKWAEVMSEPLKALGKREQEALAKIMDVSRNTYRDPNDKSSLGKFFNITEFETEYIKHIGRLPTDEEATAYAIFVQQSDMDWVFRSVNMYKAKARMGIQNAEISIGGKVVKLEGKEIDHIPFGSRYNGSVAYFDGKKIVYKRINDPGVSSMFSKKSLEKEGLRVIQTFSPEDSATRETLGVAGPVNFIVSKQLKMGALQLDKQLNYNPGFHRRYKENLKFIKQARIGRDGTGRKIYYGDTVFLGTSNAVKGAKELALIEEARLAIKNKTPDLLDSIIARGLPIEKKELLALFEEGGKKQRYDVDTPFKMVDSNESALKGTLDIVGEVEDFSNSPYNLSKQLQDEYTGKRDGPLWSISEGTEDNPTFSMAEAPLADPITTQIEAMNRLIKDRHFNDYQIASAESFVMEFGDMFKGMTAQEARRNPVYAVANGTLVGDKLDSKYASAVASQIAIKNLLGRQSLIGNQMAWLQGKILSAAYRRGGEKFVQAIDNKTASLLKGDPVAKFRAIAYHTKIGLFNPVQVALQSQTLVSINAISPKHGPGATMVSKWMRQLDLLPGDKVIEAQTAEKAAKLTPGWTKEEFLDSLEGMKRTGWDIVKHEASIRNDMSDHKLFSSKTGKFLEWSGTLFTGTERFVRIAGWNTAYKEYLAKTGKKVGSLTDNDLKNILDRADDLTINMTKSSHTFWQEGNWSMMTQFWGYTMRMHDLMTGVRLTKREKIQLLSVNSMMYGIPVAAAPLLPIWPWEDSIRQNLIETGVDTDRGLAGLIMNGVVASTVAGITDFLGERQQIDLAGRWGTNSLPILWNLNETRQGETGTHELAALFGGASGTIVAEIAGNGWEVVKDLGKLMATGEGADVLWADVLNAGKTVSSYNTIEKAWSAYNTGVMKTKSGQILDPDYDTFDAVFHAMTGVDSQSINDTMLMFRAEKQIREFEAKKTKDAKVWIRRYFAEMDRGELADRGAAKEYIDKARAVLVSGGFRQDQIMKIITSVREEETLSDKAIEQLSKAYNDPEKARDLRIKLLKKQELDRE